MPGPTVHLRNPSLEGRATSSPTLPILRASAPQRFKVPVRTKPNASERFLECPDKSSLFSAPSVQSTRSKRDKTRQNPDSLDTTSLLLNDLQQLESPLSHSRPAGQSSSSSAPQRL